MAQQHVPVILSSEMARAIQVKVDFLLKKVERDNFFNQFLKNTEKEVQRLEINNNIFNKDTLHAIRGQLDKEKAQLLYSQQVIKQGINSVITDFLNAIEGSTVPDLEEDPEKEAYCQFMEQLRTDRNQG
ncbi:hypothetical protein CAEBREN_05212 [Caenorhabditis brenneri]|uniref:Uncharacterized protein n=1 Tax=Caenorhabditis brenneri TaxID=135651 RepID=G0PA76_CAEBE|nr:hypothetical protein CAEBREN_05212 [Caenorhabditis brenneri]